MEIGALEILTGLSAGNFALLWGIFFRLGKLTVRSEENSRRIDALEKAVC